MNTNEVRARFLNFFKLQGHQIVSSDSLIPSGDPTLLFSSAGMVQFKKHFLGQVKFDFRRAASSQKCLRTSDIDRVGITARHLTFFEMLGNFSFGEYFKKDAIAWGWEFLTKDAGLNPDHLYASIYKEDEEAFGLWKKIVPESKIVRLGEDSNFWTMGPTGPCGPCSEILVDRGEQFSKDHQCPGPGCDCDRYLEVWNLVFTQFNRKENGKLDPLPQKNIDTGMGLERLSMVVNRLESVYATDLFQSIILEIKKIFSEKCSEKSTRMISDHIRACTFLICDGIIPSNEGRGYILRRLLRRALRQGWTQGVKEPFLYQLAGVVAKDMKEAYPELSERVENIKSIIKTEEENSLETIESGTRSLEDEIRKISGKSVLKFPLGKIEIPGEKVFGIYDTYGLDKEIQKEIIKDFGGDLVFSEEEFEKAKEKASETARKGWKGSGEKDVTLYSEISKIIPQTTFIGYDSLEVDTQITTIFRRIGEQLEVADILKQGEEGEIILELTPFYAESGGQVGDKGVLISLPTTLAEAEVVETEKPFDGIISHHVKVRAGEFETGNMVRASVNQALRQETMRHHTATHLLHAALRKILGTQVTQAGSLVSSEKLRLDFTYPRAMTIPEIVQTEREVNLAILKNVPRQRDEKSLNEARKTGALAFFGDKYGSKVFVVQYPDISAEVCGGTHCLSTGEIGFFKIISESSVASGVRRIEAVAGMKALDFLQNQDKLFSIILDKLKSSPEEITDKIDRLIQKQAELEREITALKRKGIGGGITNWIKNAKTLSLQATDPVKIVSEKIDSTDMESLREMADMVRGQLKSGIVLLATEDNGKISFAVTLTKNCVEKGYHAGKIAKEFAKEIGGSGGGKELFAQGGGKNVSDFKNILEKFIYKLKDKEGKNS